MNVLNDQDVTSFCQGLATRAASQPLQAWLARNLRKHMLRSPELHRRIDRSDVEGMVVAGRLWETPPWLDEAFRRGDAVYLFDAEAIPDFAASISQVIDHRNAEPAPQMDKVSVPEAIAAADEWEKSQSRVRLQEFAREFKVDLRTAAAILSRQDSRVAALWPEKPERVSTLHSGQEFDLMEIVHPSGLDREGILMDHCVATYKDSLAQGAVRILSLRDRNGIPHVTIELGKAPTNVGGREAILWKHAAHGVPMARQIRGMGNGRPAPHMAKALAQSLAAVGVKVEESERNALGLPWNLSIRSTVNLHAVARALPSEVRALGPAARSMPPIAVMTAIHAVQGNPEAAALMDMPAIIGALCPTPADLVRKEETLSERPLTRSVTWQVPNALLVGILADQVSRLQSATDSFAAMGREIIDQIRKAPNDVHRVEPLLGLWRDPLPFFAWCGLASEWMAAREEAHASRRSHLAAERLSAKQRLRASGVDETERAELMNAINVQIPRLMTM